MLKKVILLGTTGAGKSSFLENITKSDIEKDVPRNVKLEEMQIFNSFEIVDKSVFSSSTTTISINAQSMLFYVTRSNSFGYNKLNGNNAHIPLEEIETVFPVVIFDLPGQQRFEFMQDFGLYGADAVFIFSDGTNVQSIERVTHYIELIREEEKKTGKNIPIGVFVNKRDLAEKGYYVGAERVESLVKAHNIAVAETSNKDMHSFEFPIRLTLEKIHGLPIPIEKVLKGK